MNQHCYHEYCWDYSHCSVILYCYVNIVFTMIVITQLEIVNDCLSIKGKWLSIISFFNYVTEKGSWSSHPMLIIMVKKSMRVSGKMERWLVMVKWGKTWVYLTYRISMYLCINHSMPQLLFLFFVKHSIKWWQGILVLTKHEGDEKLLKYVHI